MNEPEKVKMTVNIGGEHLSLSVDFDRQNAVRDTENAIANLYNTWRQRWPGRSDKEILAMVAYQFASFYQELNDRNQKAALLAEEANNMLRGIINDAAIDNQES